jgi:hypothetical protein
LSSLATIANDLAGGGGVAAGIAGLLALVAVAVMLWQRPRLRGTTLIAPWRWSLVAVASLVGVELWIGLRGSEASGGAAPARFAAALSTFCPIMALLGAKRPQNRGWQLIVLSLWLVLSLPSGEWLLYGGVAEIHPARFWFLLILVGTGAMNRMGTRYWPSSLLYCAGQIILVMPFFTTAAPLSAPSAALVGTSAIVLSWLLVAVGIPRSRAVTVPLDRVWLDFRDGFGVVWSLRVVERMNASARMYDWPIALTWGGFVPRDSHDNLEIPAVVDESLRTLLRRFVSSEWIDARIEGASLPAPRGVPIG